MTCGAFNQESKIENRRCLLWLFFLVACFCLLRCPVIAEYFDYHFDEHFYTNGALGMLKGGDYLTPHTAEGELRFNKPPLTYWLVILGFKLFGVSPFSARLPFLLLGCALLGLTYKLAGLLLKDRNAAVLTAALLASNATFIYHVGYSITDGLVSLGVLLAHYGFMRVLVLGERKRRYLFYGYLGTGLAVATKGLPGLLPVMFAWLYALRKRGHSSFPAGKDECPLFLVDGLAIFLCLLLCAWWPLTEAFIYGRGFWQSFLYDQAGRRFESGNFIWGLLRNMGINILYYPAVLVKAFLPWSLLAPVLAIRFRATLLAYLKARPRLWLYILAACLLEYIFYLPANIHRSRYLMPVFPLMAVLIAAGLQAVASAVNVNRILVWVFSALAGCGLVLGTVLLVIHRQDAGRNFWCALLLAGGSAAALLAMLRGSPPARAAMAGVFLVLCYSVFDLVGGPEFTRSPYIQVFAQLKDNGLEEERVGLGPKVMQELPAQLRVLSGGKLDLVRVNSHEESNLAAVILKADSATPPSREGYRAVEAGYGFWSKGKSLLPGRNNDRLEWLLSAVRGNEEGFKEHSRTRYWLLLRITAGSTFGSRSAAGKGAGDHPAME